jgi:carbon-monoxide dehydrogenase large subunit
MAAKDLTDKGRRIAAAVFGTDTEMVRFDNGRFSVPGTNYNMGWFELAACLDEVDLPEKLASGLMTIADNEMHTPVFPNGCAICEIEVDPDTGELELTRYAAVDDVGRCVNPMIVEGQIHGAVAQGVGQALSELFYCDPQTGQPLTGSFMDYAIPRASALPRLDTEIIEVLSPTNPLGIKAGGEGGTTPALAVIVSAVLDALKPLGVRDIEMPVTPIRIWQAIQDARGGGTR